VVKEDAELREHGLSENELHEHVTTLRSERARDSLFRNVPFQLLPNYITNLLSLSLGEPQIPVRRMASLLWLSITKHDQEW
jgi:hypothetical protein